METFGMRVSNALQKYGHLCVGIDPHPSLLQQWNLEDSPEGLAEFSFRVLDACTGQVGFVKPQSAFFERHGAAGIAILEDIVKKCREYGLISINDVKRGDIGSTMAGYAQAYLGTGSLSSDAITLSPYLGVGSLQPAVDLAKENGRGVFALCLTSNPEGASVQHASDEENISVAGRVLQYARDINSACQSDIGPVGLVVGATIGDAVTKLGLNFEDSQAALLVPGIGAQGGTAQDVKNLFGKATKNVIAAVSRGVLSAGPDGIAEAVKRANEEISLALK